MYTEDMRIYTYSEIDTYLQYIEDYPVHNSYVDVASAFDIEVSSWYENEEKKAAMYVWQFGINGRVIIGRSWKEFTTMLKKINIKLNLSKQRKLVVYVHNLSYEYQFIKELLKWEEVFNTEERKPLKALTKDFIEFRCSYRLSGKSLSKTADELMKYPVRKLEGYLDYDLIRHSKTELTQNEIDYCVNDIRVVMNYIQEKIEQEGSISKIPLTITGYVRRFCKKKCFGEKYTNTKKYAKMMSKMRLTIDEFSMCKEAFMGGYVHCNYWHAGQTVKNVDCYDFCSSYIAAMISFDRFPMSAPIHRGSVDINKYEQFINKRYACISKMTFYDVRLKDDIYFPPISRSKCSCIEGCGLLDNGRVVEAKFLTTTITEQDYMTYKECYNYSKVIVEDLITFDTGYLPTEFVDAILELYELKTKLKGVEGKETEYMLYKGMLNSSYGMCVTDISQHYEDIEDYNNKMTRFLYYPWGVWISAVSRRNLYTGILECGEDLVYCDTDSLKTLNGEAHRAYINKYNNEIKEKLHKAMDHHGFSYDRVSAQDIYGKSHTLGIWDYEGNCSEFKGIRAKSYISKKDGKYKLTLSGVNSDCGLKYLKTLGDPIKNFTQSICFPAEYTGKKLLTYIDNEIKGTVKDYNGVTYKYKEKSCIHMSDCEFDMSEESDFLNFIDWITQGTVKR